MKRILAVLILATGLLASTSIHAQYSPVVVGVKAGLNFSSLSEGYKTRLRYQIGVTLDYEITENFYILSGLEFTVLGGKRKSHVDLPNVGSTKPTVNPMYLKIPLHLACKVSIADNARLIFDTGPYLAMGVGGKTKTSSKDGGVKTSVEMGYFGKNKARRFDTGLGMGLGVEVDDLVFKIGYDYGIINMQQVDGMKAKNRNMEVTVGYKFY